MSPSFNSLSLREYILKMSERFHVLTVEEPVSPIYEVGKVLQEYDTNDAVLIFKRLKDFENFIGVGNLLNTRHKLHALLNVKNDVELYRKVLAAEEAQVDLWASVDITSSHDFKVVKDFDLRGLPFAIYYEREPRPYLTSGIVFGLDLRSKFVNLSIHRLSVIDRDKLVIRLVPRHLYAIWRRNAELGHDTPVAIVMGVNPVLHLAAACSPPFGISELVLVERLIGVRPKVHIFDDLPVPVDAELVLIGKILRDVQDVEGPFVDVLQLYDDVRLQPVVKVERILINTRHERVIMHYLLPAGSEHRLLMSIEKEAKIWKFVNNVVPEVVAVRLTPGGGSWLHAVIAIKKQTDGDAKNAILAAFAAHPSLKHVVVVDPDINVDDPRDVEWAIATRFRGDEDLVVIRYVRGSTLDPSAIDQESGLTVKIGIDATRPLSGKVEKFEKAKIPVKLKVRPRVTSQEDIKQLLD